MKLQVVKTDKGYVAISEQIPRQDHNMRTDDEGKWVISLYDSRIGTLSQEYRGLWRIRWKVSDSVGYLLSEPHPPENHRMIVATDTTFKLEGIPQFEIDDDAFAAWNKESMDFKDISEYRDYEAGYKAAQEKGCYTEEDLKEAIRLSYGHAKQSKLSVGDVEGKVINIIKQPKQLVSIEVEETFKRPSEIDISNEMKTSGNINNLSLIQTPKVIKSEDHPDGLLTVKQYYYENN